MALTLLEASKRRSETELQQVVIELFSRQTDILRVLPFVDIKGNSLRYNLEDTLPGIAFRGVGEGYTESTGVINPQTESLAIVGGDIDVDKFIVRTMGEDQRAAQESMKIKALSHGYSNTFIKGDTLTTPKEFDGLQTRLTGKQVIANTASGKAALSLSKLDEAIDAVDNPTHLLMTKAHARGLTAAARNTSVGGFISYSKDEFGRRVTEYNGLPILIADRNSDLYATIGDNEAGNGSGTGASSIYVLSLREGMLHGIQTDIPMVTDLGELDDKPMYRTRIEWYTGMVLMHPRAAARLRYIDSTLPVVA